ncbi:thioredoxin domain-containing protein 6 isoform X2 [Phoca vitulina]|uniref:thioredoxin domain-containing protein 6 isoform X2 n=1 Tax=Phoca vitulina TaxID=9720 RepID=UPI0013964CA4|nr:thioredoxin domain-containing protein 6 isoform X2 [Phoca vitulina]
MPEGLHRRAPPLHAGKGLCRKPPGEPRPCGRQAPLPTPHPVVFILHRGIYFAATYVYLKGTGALSEGGSGFAGFRSGLSPGCCWEQSEPEVTGLLSSLQSHGKQEEGNCPAVVDVYQGWCGPCKPVVSLFQKMRMEVGLDLLHFALAEADCLDVLEKYRGRCEPNFLFYAGGELVAVVRGANAPLLQKTIREQLEAEKKVLAEGRKRKVEAFEKLVHHMCSGPSHLLILTRPEGTEDVTAAWRTLMGPCDPDVARREQPDSLRAQFGTEMPFNAVHGSQDRDAASRELALLFPTFKFSDEVLEASLVSSRSESS